MRFAILSDLHANLEATEAVMADARERDCTHYVCLGDVVGYNANPHECVEIVQKTGLPDREREPRRTGLARRIVARFQRSGRTGDQLDARTT